MSLLSHLTPVLAHLKSLGSLFSDRVTNATSSQKIIVVTMTASVAVLGVLARYMRRKRLVVNPKKYRRWTGKRSRASGIKSPNGDAVGAATYSGGAGGSVASGGGRSSFAGSRASRAGPPSVVTVSERGSVASGSNVTGSALTGMESTERLTPQQLGVMGMEALETSIGYWEDAMAGYRAGVGAVLSADEAAFCRDLQALLDSAIELQEKGELLFLDQRSVLFGGETASPESFASAVDRVADLGDFDDDDEDDEGTTGGQALYVAALARLEEGSGVPCRALRTELVRCGSDNEYLAKLHCLRLAYQRLLSEQPAWQWLADAGRQTLADMLLYADRDPKDFLVAYEAMLGFLRDPENRPQMEQELAARGLKALTFYDVVIDYILMDAFEDLDQPPSSVTAVVQNRWLSDGFKETALTTAVWSVLKAKRRMLRFPDGFMAHFYAISEQLVPLLAWGFLGPDDALRDTCVYFRDQVMGMLADMFNFKKCRYTNVDDLATDLRTITRQRLANVGQRLCTQ
ncbi:Mitoguardin [Carabus blaptoides fortunei]